MTRKSEIGNERELEKKMQSEPSEPPAVRARQHKSVAASRVGVHQKFGPGQKQKANNDNDGKGSLTVCRSLRRLGRGRKVRPEIVKRKQYSYPQIYTQPNAGFER